MTTGRPTKEQEFQRDVLDSVETYEITKIDIFKLLRSIGIKKDSVTSIEYNPEKDRVIIYKEK